MEVESGEKRIRSKNSKTLNFPDSSPDSGEREALRETCRAKNKKAAAEIAKKKGYSALLKEKLAGKKESPLCVPADSHPSHTPKKAQENTAAGPKSGPSAPPKRQTTQPKKRKQPSESDSSEFGGDEGGVVPQALHEELEGKYRNAKKRARNLEVELCHFTTKCTELKEEKKKLEEEVEQYKGLNITLQQNLTMLLQSKERSDSDVVTFRVPRPSSPVPRSSSPSPGPGIFDIEGDKIHIGSNVWVNKSKWEMVAANTKDTMFVKELAVVVWGTATLKNKSLSGKECPTTKGEAKPPLTPTKVTAVRECFDWWLQKQNVTGDALLQRRKKMGKYISEKIQDINRKK